MGKKFMVALGDIMVAWANNENALMFNPAQEYIKHIKEKD